MYSELSPNPTVLPTSNFLLTDGELFYICRRKRDKSAHLAKVVTSAIEASELFKEFHDSAIGGHFGWEKTHCALIQRFYWPGMQADVRKWVS